MINSDSWIVSSHNYHDPSLFTQYKINQSINIMRRELKHKQNPNIIRFRNSSSSLLNETNPGSSHHFAYVTNNHKLTKSFFPKITNNLSRLTTMKATINDKLENEIFQKVFKDKDRDPPIDNKFNLFYAKNEGQYIHKMEKLNEKLEKQGKATKPIRKNVEYIDNKLNQIKDKISFIGGVTNYCYPGIIIYKIAQISKSLRLQKEKRKHFSQSYIRPCEKADQELKDKNKQQKLYFNKSISISMSSSNQVINQLRGNFKKSKSKKSVKYIS